MLKALNEKIKNKNVLILGFGREGRSTLKRVLECGCAASVTISDKRDVSDELPTNVSSIAGNCYLDFLDDYDIVFKTPGIVLPKDASEYKCEITSETEIFIEKYKDRIIGITGTKGKSTTSSFIYYALKNAGIDTVFAGNIGIPVFDICEDINENTAIVVELSCHQLEYLKTSPKRAVLLNIYEDHLDHYGTREKYALAKKHIYFNQTDKDILYVNKETLKECENVNSKVVLCDKSVLPFKSFETLRKTNFKGEHNLSNLSFAYNVCKEYGVTDESFIESVENFETLSHRLEHVGPIDCVDYYDDSISTTVMSTINAILSVKNASVILIGGMERNIDYTELLEFISESDLEYVICMYESGKRFYDAYELMLKKDTAPIAILTENLEEAVEKAKKKVKPGGAVLLSPAAASYGYFKNFEERGERFKELIKK